MFPKAAMGLNSTSLTSTIELHIAGERNKSSLGSLITGGDIFQEKISFQALVQDCFLFAGFDLIFRDLPPCRRFNEVSIKFFPALLKCSCTDVLTGLFWLRSCSIFIPESSASFFIISSVGATMGERKRHTLASMEPNPWPETLERPA